ncbi:hypothetical protein ACFPRL_15850 [Pseudoclavibacter helvolus]
MRPTRRVSRVAAGWTTGDGCGSTGTGPAISVDLECVMSEPV